MDRTNRRSRDNTRFRPQAEAVEARLLMTQAGYLGPAGILNNPPGAMLVRPNTPVAPFGALLANATFVDPTVHIVHGNHVVAGLKSFIGPYATLNASTGFIKIGSASAVLDNATILSNPTNNRVSPSSVLIGDQVLVGYGATILGPSVIGGYYTQARATGIGSNAVIDGATISAGAFVGSLARVGPGVTIPAGIYVLPGANVTTQAEATNPALGKVEIVPAAVLTDFQTALTRSSQLAAGYTNNYQGQSGTGVNPGVPTSITTVFNGNLAAVEGTSSDPGPTSTTAATGITFEPSKTGPKFVGPILASVEGDLYYFHSRITGDVRFNARAATVKHQLGRSTSIRADQGQPFTFANAPTTGYGVTINSPLGGTVTTGTTTKTVGGIAFGANFQAGANSVILGGADASYTFGNNVTVGQGAVLTRTSVGTGAVIGAQSYISGSTIPAGAVIAPRSIIVNNVLMGQVQS